MWVAFAGEVPVVDGEEVMVGEKEGGEGFEVVGEWVRWRGAGAWAIGRWTSLVLLLGCCGSYCDCASE